jgi:hypothetical protein
MDSDSPGLEIGRIVIVRRLTDEDDWVDVRTEGELRYVETLGMLLMAQQILDRRHSDGDEEG